MTNDEIAMHPDAQRRVADLLPPGVLAGRPAFENQQEA